MLLLLLSYLLKRAAQAQVEKLSATPQAPTPRKTEK